MGNATAMASNETGVGENGENIFLTNNFVISRKRQNTVWRFYEAGSELHTAFRINLVVLVKF